MNKSEALHLIKEYCAAAVRLSWGEAITGLRSRFPDDGSENKAMRWLGFIQGVHFARGSYSLESLKDHSRVKAVPSGDLQVAGEMNVYLIDTHATTYYAIAMNMSDATAAAWSDWGNTDDRDAIEDGGFTITKIEKPHRPNDYYDDSIGRRIPFTDLVSGCSSARIFPC